jgi:hypothetical protein
MWSRTASIVISGAMKKRWTYQSYVDADLKLSPETRKQAEQRMSALMGRHRSFRWLVLGMCAATPFVVIFGGRFVVGLLNDLSVPHWIGSLLGQVGVAALCTAACLAVFWRTHVRPMRLALREMGYDICPRCGYWLKGLPTTEARCPECGEGRTSTQRDELD